MPTNRDPLAAYIIAEDLLMCVQDKLVEIEQDVPERSCVIAGGIAWDDCECGQLVVAINNLYYSQQFPRVSTDTADTPGQSRCGPRLAVVEYLVSILRCAPTGGNDARPPSCASLAEAAQIATRDAWAVRTGVQCCLSTMYNTRDPETNAKLITDYQIGVQNMVGPAGMCQGSEMSVLVGIINACVCGEHS